MKDRRTPWVIKLGGSELQSGQRVKELARKLAEVIDTAQPTVIVHGGGDEITRRAAALGVESREVRGRRVTDEKMLEVVIDVLAQRVNHRLAASLSSAGVPAHQVPSFPQPLITVVPAGDPPGSLGLVGRPVSVDCSLLNALFREGLLPVVAPLGRDGKGQIYNVNADEAAGAIAAALRARLSLVTDVPGVLDRFGKLVPELTPEGARSLIESNVGVGGMIPKLEAAVTAVERGATGAWIGPLDELEIDPSPRSGTVIVGSHRFRRMASMSPQLEVPASS